MLTPDELPGWTRLDGQHSGESSLFASTRYADRFVGEASIRLAHDGTGEILVQHVGVLHDADASAMQDDLNAPLIDWPAGEIIHETDHEAWAVSPLQVPPLGDQSIGFRLTAGLPDARLVHADNVYERRGRIASALVRLSPLGAAPARDGIAPLAELADRKLASLAEKIG